MANKPTDPQRRALADAAGHSHVRWYTDSHSARPVPHINGNVARSLRDAGLIEHAEVHDVGHGHGLAYKITQAGREAHARAPAIAAGPSSVAHAAANGFPPHHPAAEKFTQSTMGSPRLGGPRVESSRPATAAADRATATAHAATVAAKSGAGTHAAAAAAHETAAAAHRSALVGASGREFGGHMSRSRMHAQAATEHAEKAEVQTGPRGGEYTVGPGGSKSYVK